MSVESLTPRVREALGVSSSYDKDTIPAAIRRAMRRLLRDYNFPKSVRTRIWFTNAPDPRDDLIAGRTFFALPDGFKKELLLHYRSPGDDPPRTVSYSDPLKKNNGFRLPHGDEMTMAKYYWLEGTGFSIDKPLYEDMYDPLELVLYYQSFGVTDNEEWFAEDFEDIIYILTVYRTAAEMRKPEVMQSFGPLWQEEMLSLAIYLNELEFDNLNVMMREPTWRDSERYPV